MVALTSVVHGRACVIGITSAAPRALPIWPNTVGSEGWAPTGPPGSEHEDRRPGQPRPTAKPPIEEALMDATMTDGQASNLRPLPERTPAPVRHAERLEFLGGLGGRGPGLPGAAGRRASKRARRQARSRLRDLHGRAAAPRLRRRRGGLPHRRRRRRAEGRAWCDRRCGLPDAGGLQPGPHRRNRGLRGSSGAPGAPRQRGHASAWRVLRDAGRAGQGTGGAARSNGRHARPSRQTHGNEPGYGAAHRPARHAPPRRGDRGAGLYGRGERHQRRALRRARGRPAPAHRRDRPRSGRLDAARPRPALGRAGHASVDPFARPAHAGRR